jgi:hypothetical protein
MRTGTSEVLDSQPARAQFLVPGVTQLQGRAIQYPARCMDFAGDCGGMFWGHLAHGRRNNPHCTWEFRGPRIIGRLQVYLPCWQIQQMHSCPSCQPRRPQCSHPHPNPCRSSPKRASRSCLVRAVRSGVMDQTSPVRQPHFALSGHNVAH